MVVDHTVVIQKVYPGLVKMILSWRVKDSFNLCQVYKNIKIAWLFAYVSYGNLASKGASSVVDQKWLYRDTHWSIVLECCVAESTVSNSMSKEYHSQIGVMTKDSKQT